MDLFPSNGLDRSLHAPVFIGVLLLTFFKETFGWTNAGLVVPGYLATVLLAAPLTGGLVIVESIVTYILASALGRWLPRTGLWSIFFGRERFLLLIVCALVVRLGAEGALLPNAAEQLGLLHSRVLYSLGLVLVPLLANTYWNAGFVRAFPRVGLVTLITYLVVSEILLDHTNFTISRFQIANESVSLAFLESPHAHIILLIGSLLGARNNLHYGWDYNGILVPALLAVAWYEPLKVLTTVVEALLIYFCCLWLMKTPIFARALIVGSRQTLMAFSVGFLFKYLSGFAMQRYAPTVQMIDYFGFGYLLPTLLAVKIWNKGKVLVVLGPALQVSLIAFPLGSAVGFLLRGLDSDEPSARAAVNQTATEETPNVALALMFGDSAPAPHRTGTLFKGTNTYAATLEALLAVRDSPSAVVDVTRLKRFGMSLSPPLSGGWRVFAPASDDPEEDVIGPRVGVQNGSRQGQRWLVVAEVDAAASATIAVAARLAEYLDAAVLQVWSPLPALRALDEEFTNAVAGQNTSSQVVVVQLSDQQASWAELSVVGQLPQDITPAALEQLTSMPVRVRWLEATSSDASLTRITLTLPRNQAQLFAADFIGSAPLLDWGKLNQPELSAKLDELTRTDAASFRAPSTADLRVFSAAVLEPWLSLDTAAPTDWQRAVAAQFGYHFARVSGAVTGFVLFEPAGSARHGQATLLRRLNHTGDPGVCIGVPAPRWEQAILGSGVQLFAGLEADALVVHGALANAAESGEADARSLRGRRSYFQRMLEAWLNAGGRCVTLRGIPEDSETSASVVLTLHSEQGTVQTNSPWLEPLNAQLTNLGLQPMLFDGSLTSVAFEGTDDPAMAYSRSFSPGNLAMLWLDSSTRSLLSRSASPANTVARLNRFSELAPLSPEQWVERLRGCRRATSGSGACKAFAPAQCDTAAVRHLLFDYLRTANPHVLAAALNQAPCAPHALHDPRTDAVWVALARLERAHAYATLVPLTTEPQHPEPLKLDASDELKPLLAMPVRPLEVQLW